MQGTIKFPGNPWPKGHAIKELNLGVRLHDDAPERPAHTSLDLYLKSEEYSHPQTWEEACDAADKQFEDDPDISDWESMVCWNNFHACHLDPALTHKDLVLTTEGEPFEIVKLGGFSRHIDPVATIDEDDDEYFDARAFSTYILGHDAVAGHDIQLTRVASTGLFGLKWTGKAARAYVGSYAFEHSFTATAEGIPFLGYKSYFNWPDGKSTPIAAREARMRGLAERLVKDAGALTFHPGDYPGADILRP